MIFRPYIVCFHLALCWLLFVTGRVYADSQLQEIRAWRAPDHLRLVLDFSQPFSFTYRLLTQPDRLVIDLPKVSYTPAFINSVAQFNHSPIIQSINYQYQDEVTRITINLNYQITTDPFVLTPQYGYGYRLVFDLYHNLPVVQPTIPQSIPQQEVSQASATTKQRTDALANKHDQGDKQDKNVQKNRKDKKEKNDPYQVNQQNNRKVTIVIDPGHGGEDPGALGYKGTQEKDLVFAISRYLQQKINSRPGFKAILTRTGDYYVSLAERAQIARQKNADLLLSIHANSLVKNRKVHGAIVFALSNRGASSELGRWMEKAENDADLVGGMRQIALANRPKVLREVLLDLAMTASLTKSITIGKSILKEIATVTELHSAQVEQANFVVLRSPDVPSLLVETGFISHAEEGKKLRQPAYQQALATSLAKAIIGWFEQTPPSGTYLAWQKENNNPYLVNHRPAGHNAIWHKVQSGESLSAIAAKYNTQVITIEKLNRLKKHAQIYPGQKLKIAD